ncbi:MAG: primosomal protein N' [Bacteroidales bacterium]|nr:primosomal protein N' [Bacteroidales bacterium]
MVTESIFADVLLPLPVPGLFTYRIPVEMAEEISLWKRAVVQFGSKKVYTGIVVNIHSSRPEKYTPKTILSLVDDRPVVNEIQYRFWTWMAEYYMCYRGEVMNVALPSALKLSSETRVIVHPDYSGDMTLLDKRELQVLEALSIRGKLFLSEISSFVGQKKVMPLIRTLIEKGVVLTEEQLDEGYKPRKQSFVRLSDEYLDEKKLHGLFDSLQKRAFKQLETLMMFVRLSGFSKNRQEKEVLKTAITNEISHAAGPLSALISKGILQVYTKEVSRFESHDAEKTADSIVLTVEQSKALNDIRENFVSKDVVLLHGVTSSGKTEIYIKLIHEALSAGKQVLYLLPEIALTTQIINRLRRYFGNSVGVYHSRHNPLERVEIWNEILENKDKGFQVILGPRSSLFLPYHKLGLVIVDEEHDTSFKQYDPAPRYNARDAAVYLATLHGAKVLLGSATPSIESYFNTKTGKYGLVELNTRYGDIQLPEILVADIKKEKKQKTMKSHFSSLLFDHIEEALDKKEQVILFQNRRGFSLRLECEQCNWMPECVNCDVTLIYHKHDNRLRCHYCGYSTTVPGHCVSCGSNALKMKGFGTEQVEEEMEALFPDAVIRRMDLDTTRSKHSHQTLIQDFEQRKIQILVGTQMVTKGLDFDNVGVVGILNADSMISFPDFRSFERSYQLMVQVAGRAGRKHSKGKVIIQAYNPRHSVIDLVIRHDYTGMYQSQILERRNFKYPPFYRLIQLSLKHKNPDLLNKASIHLAGMLRKKFEKNILGPEFPLVSRVKGLFIKNILVKLGRGKGIAGEKADLMLILKEFGKETAYKSIRIIIDVDPV